MTSIKIHGGDFIAGRSGKLKSGVLTLPTAEHSFRGEQIPLHTVMRVEAINKEMKQRTGAAVGRGAVAAMIGGPIGAVGAVLGGPAGITVAVTSAIIGFTTTNHTSDVTFEAEFEGGRRLLAATNTTTYTKLLAAAFDYKPPSARPVTNQAPEARGGPTVNPRVVLGIVGGLVVVGGMIDGSPLAWGVGVGAIVFIVGRSIINGWNKNASAANVLQAARMMLTGWFGHLTKVEIAARLCGLLIFSPVLILGIAGGLHSASGSAQGQAKEANTLNARQRACDMALAEYQRRKSGAYECHETTYQTNLEQYRVSVIAKGIYGFWMAFDRNIYTMPTAEADVFVDPVQARVIKVARLCSVTGDAHRACSAQ